MEITACGAESSCDVLVFRVVPIAELSPLPQSCTSALQALWAVSDNVAPEPLGPFTCWPLVPWSSLLLVLGTGTAGSSSLRLALLSWPLLSHTSTGLEGPAREEFRVCHSCKPHTKKYPYPRDENGWYSCLFWSESWIQESPVPTEWASDKYGFTFLKLFN